MTCPLCRHPEHGSDRCDGRTTCDEPTHTGGHPCACDGTGYNFAADPPERLINGLYRVVEPMPAGAQPDDDPEAFAAELVTEYAAAIERVRERAQEARAGARIMRKRAGTRYGLTPADVHYARDAGLVALRARQADERLGIPLRHTPIGAAGLAALNASANQQTGGNRQ